MVRTLKTDGTQSLKSIVQDAQNDLKDICLMLSLVSRQKVQWYEITARSYKSKDISNTLPTAKRRVGGLTSRYSEHEDPLIDQRDLVHGGFRDLLSRFQCCQHREMLRRAIAFEIASHEIGGGLESNYILCYSALEAIAGETLSADSSIHRYMPSQWKLLRRTLEKTIAEFAENQRLLSTLVDYTQKRLPGLARPAIADVILHLTQSLSIKVDDLWPDGVPFDQGLRAALRIRNLLVHRAIIVDANAMHDNLVRLQALTERFILKLLGWPENKVWVWSNQRLKRVNR